MILQVVFIGKCWIAILAISVFRANCASPVEFPGGNPIQQVQGGPVVLSNILPWWTITKQILPFPYFRFNDWRRNGFGLFIYIQSCPKSM